MFMCVCFSVSLFVLFDVYIQFIAMSICKGDQLDEQLALLVFRHVIV